MSDGYNYPGSELDLFAHATHWKRYIYNQLHPIITGDVLEVGAGIGETTKILQSGGEKSWTCIEPDRDLSFRLIESFNRHKFRSKPEVITGTISDVPVEARYDTILYVDVLEHIESDRLELDAAAGLLKPGGHLIVVAPAHPYLFSPFDAAIGHYRRYNRNKLIELTPGSTEIERIRYLDSIGFFASLGNRLILGAGMPDLKQIKIWDRFMVPLSVVLDPLLGYRFGKTIVCVWRRKANATHIK
jgi:SAM-dependent methyltransferase